VTEIGPAQISTSEVARVKVSLSEIRVTQVSTSKERIGHRRIPFGCSKIQPLKVCFSEVGPYRNKWPVRMQVGEIHAMKISPAYVSSIVSKVRLVDDVFEGLESSGHN
jgi:hypothetical protein